MCYELCCLPTHYSLLMFLKKLKRVLKLHIVRKINSRRHRIVKAILSVPAGHGPQLAKQLRESWSKARSNTRCAGHTTSNTQTRVHILH